MRQSDEVTASEAGVILGVSDREVRRRAQAGEIPSRRVGTRLILIKRSDLGQANGEAITPSPDDELTVPQAAEMLGVSGRQVRYYVARKLLRCKRLGKSMLVFNRADVQAFVRPQHLGRPVGSVTKKRGRKSRG